MNYLATMKKALVPVAVGGALTILGLIGVTGDMTVREALTLAVTAGLTWAVPNARRR